MSDTTMFTKKPWSGTSMDDIYYGHGPWNFETPPIYVSKDHKVLYHVPATLKSAPKPHISCHVYHWDDDHVRMPYSSKNLFPAKNVRLQLFMEPCYMFYFRLMEKKFLQKDGI